MPYHRLCRILGLLLAELQALTARRALFCTRRCEPKADAMQDGLQASLCTPDYIGVGVCSQDALQDRCGTVRAYGNRRCWDASQQGASESFWGYKFGPSSRCLPARSRSYDGAGSPLLLVGIGAGLLRCISET